jgi:hypothetical protein
LILVGVCTLLDDQTPFDPEDEEQVANVQMVKAAIEGTNGRMHGGHSFGWWAKTSYSDILEQHLTSIKAQIRNLELEARDIAGELAYLRLTEMSTMRAFVIVDDADPIAGAAADHTQASFDALLDFFGLADEG